MAYHNELNLIGNLTRDPQLRELQSGTPVVDFGVATNRRYRTAAGEERDEACFIDCVAFGRMAENISQYCEKGAQVFVQGFLKLEQWEDRQGGGKRSKHVCVVDNIQFLGKRGDRAADETTDQRVPERRPAPARSASAAGPVRKTFDDKAKFKDADIPF